MELHILKSNCPKHLCLFRFKNTRKYFTNARKKKNSFFLYLEFKLCGSATHPCQKTKGFISACSFTNFGTCTEKSQKLFQNFEIPLSCLVFRMILERKAQHIYHLQGIFLIPVTNNFCSTLYTKKDQETFFQNATCHL